MGNPTTAMRDAPMSGLANLMAMKGRDNDSMLVHLSPSEVSNLNKLSGNTMTINPHTGLPEGRSRLLEAVLPALLSIGVGIATGGASIPAQMAAQAAAGYGGARLMGKEHDEALTSAAISGVTAGLFGGTGSDALAGGRELGREATKGTLKSTVPAGLQHVVKDTTGAMAKDLIARGGTDAASQALAKVAEEDLKKRAIAQAAGGFNPWLASSGDVFGEIAARRVGEGAAQESYKSILGSPEIYKPLITHTAARTGLNALTDQMRADANRSRDLSGPPSATGELWSQPYNFDLQGPYSQQDITGAYLGDNVTPLNFYNQGYAKGGGSVQQMSTGGDIAKFISPLYGLVSLLNKNKKENKVNPIPQPVQLGDPMQMHDLVKRPVHMLKGGDIAKFISPLYGLVSLLNKNKKEKEPTPITNNYYGTGPDGQPMLMDGPPQQIHLGHSIPQQMAFGGKLGKALGIGGGSGSVSASSQGGPRGSSQGGKGKLFNSPEVLELLMKSQQDTGGSTGLDQFADITDNPTQQMERGGAVGQVTDWGGDLHQKFYGSKLMEPLRDLKKKFYGSELMEPLMRVMGKDRSKYMAGGGMMGDIPPEMLELLKAQASAPAPKAYDQLASLGQNPMQQMQEGGLTGAAEASGSMMPALQPLLQVASEEALQAVAQPRSYAQGGQPFEGRVEGRGDGMSDQIPFNIEGQQPALLSRDEYVIPADVVAMVGDGSSNAGADQFDNFIGDIRTMKYGRQVQPRELNQGLGSLLGVA
jgi:hypothetical protein